MRRSANWSIVMLVAALCTSCGVPDAPASSAAPPVRAEPPAATVTHPPAHTAAPTEPQATPTTAAPTEPQAPADSPTPAPPGETTLDGRALALWPAAAQSYRLRYDHKIQGLRAGSAIVHAQRYQEESTRQPAAVRSAEEVTFVDTTLLPVPSYMSNEIVQIEQMSWLKMDGVVMGSFPAQQQPESGLLPRTAGELGLLRYLRTAHDAGTGPLISGFPTRVYHFSLVDLDIPPDAPPEHAAIEQADGVLWLHASEGYVVQLKLTVRGRALSLPSSVGLIDGTLRSRYQLLGVDEDLSIEPPQDGPPGGAESGIGTDIPIPAGSKLRRSVPGMAIFDLGDPDTAGLVEFYRREMGARGWAEEGYYRSEPPAEEALVFRNGSRTATIQRAHGSLTILVGGVPGLELMPDDPWGDE